jgi:tellurite resistance protein TehA-like permease
MGSMIALLVHMVPLGLAAVASLVPIIAGITFSSGRNPTLKITAYILGCLLTYSVIGAIGVAIINATTELGNHGHPSTLALTIKLVIGAFFLAFALLYLAVRKVNTGSPRWLQLPRLGPGGSGSRGITMSSWPSCSESWD